MSEELKPCPFCGSEAELRYGVPVCANYQCPNENRDEQGAQFITVEQWNTRTIEDALRAQRNSLRNALAKLRGAVIDDLRHSEDEDQDRAWLALEEIKNALAVAGDALRESEE